jgi:phosphohistidine swiveling domain-containing protein
MQSFSDAYSIDTQSDYQKVGGKAHHLSVLSKIGGIHVPEWFPIPCQIMKAFCIENNLLTDIQYLNELAQDYEANESTIAILCRHIQEKIKQGTLNFQIAESILAKLKKIRNSEDDLVVVRSSGMIEDSTITSCAGLFDSILGLKTDEEVIDAIKSVWASGFNERVILQKSKFFSSLIDFEMGVVVQKFIQPKSAGVASTMVLENGFPAYEISANYGIGTSVVDGSIQPDTWRVDKKRGVILEQILGTKKEFHQFDQQEKLIVSKEKHKDQEKFCLNRNEIKKICEALKKIEDVYLKPIDVEFGIDPQGELYIFQTRALVENQSTTLLTIDRNETKSHVLLGEGNYAIPGVATGRLVYVESWSQLSSGQIKLTDQDILIAHLTTNVWTSYLDKVKGIITCEGSPNSHSMLLCREKGVSCVIGFDQKTFQKMLQYQGQIVTIDGYGKKVFLGNLNKVPVTFDQLMDKFEKVVVKPWIDINQLIPSLLKQKIAIEDEEGIWRKTPTFPVTGFQAEINLKRFDLVTEIAKNSNVKIRSKIIDSYVCNYLEPFDKYVGIFDGYTLKEAQTFIEDQKKCLDDFIKACESFSAKKEEWDSFVDIYARLRAYVWTGSALQFYAMRKAETLASELEIPQYYFDECQQAIQSTKEELDVCMQNDVHELALKMSKKPFPDSLETFKIEDLQGYEELIKLGLKYRFEHRIDLQSPIDFHFVFQRVALEVEQIKNGMQTFSSKGNFKNRFVLEDAQEVKDWLDIAITSRILQCDSHHIDARGKGIIRPKLLKVKENIFSFSIDQVKGSFDGFSV